MTINKYLQQISPEDLAYVKRYHHEIQPFRVLPSSTLEFDGQFNGGGETIFTEINLNEDHTIDDMFCTCGAGSLCVHLEYSARDCAPQPLKLSIHSGGIEHPCRCR